MNAHANKELRPFPDDVGAQRVARVYAEALLRASQQAGQAEQSMQQLDSLLDELFPADPRLERFLASGVIGRNNKGSFLEKGFRGQASEVFLNFLLVLNRHSRLDLLRAIRREYRELFEEQAQRVRVFVFTAVPLPDDQRERLRQQLRNTLHKEPALEYKVRPELLGGMVVLIGSWMYDGSVRTRLERLKNQLIERSNHEIQLRRDRFCSAT